MLPVWTGFGVGDLYHSLSDALISGGRGLQVCFGQTLRQIGPKADAFCAFVAGPATLGYQVVHELVTKLVSFLGPNIDEDDSHRPGPRLNRRRADQGKEEDAELNQTHAEEDCNSQAKQAPSPPNKVPIGTELLAVTGLADRVSCPDEP